MARGETVKERLSVTYVFLCLNAEGRGRWLGLEGSKQIGPVKVIIFLNSFLVMQLKFTQLLSTVVAHWQLTKLFQAYCP